MEGKSEMKKKTFDKVKKKTKLGWDEL